MTRPQLSLLRAAELLQDTRKDILAGNLGAHLRQVSAKGQHVDAGLTTHGNVLIVTGSDSWQDYLFYNLRPLRPLPPMAEIDQLTTHELPKRAYHKGFLLHAARIKRFLGDHKPDHIVGHSLGAAASQILGAALGSPTICLASPQVVKRRYLKPDALRSGDHAQWNVFNVAWRKDFVTKGYRRLGFRCLGHRVVLDTDEPNFGIDHFVEDYEELIVKALDEKTVPLPESWPDPRFALPVRLA